MRPSLAEPTRIRLALLFSIAWLAIADAQPVLELNPNGATPLSARVRAGDLDVVELSAIPDSHDQRHIFRAPGEWPVSITLTGLKPSTEYGLSTSVNSSSSHTENTGRLVFRTPALPTWFPPIRCVTATPDLMEPGVTLMVIYRWIDQALDRNFGLLAAVDERGEVVWHYRPHHAIHTVSLLENGHLVYIGDREGTMYEIDFLGEVKRRWHTTGIPKAAPLAASIPVDTDTFHHDVVELPSGNFLTLSTEIRRLQDYPTSENDPAAEKRTANVVGDVVVEFRPDGGIAGEHRLLDILDPYRIGYDSLGTFFWQRVYAARESWMSRDEWPRDWSHANSVTYDATDDSIIVSLYHLDAVVKIGRSSGELKWILGTPEGWREPWRLKVLKPMGEMSWAYHQHAARLTPDGNLILFDNGKYRARPFDTPMPIEASYSRVVEYEIDEDAGRVREMNSYSGAERFFSSFLGDIQPLPHTGNRLITDGGAVELPDGTYAPMGFGKNRAQVMEITPESEVAFHLDIRDERPQVGWSVYRSLRIPWSVFSPDRVNAP